MKWVFRGLCDGNCCRHNCFIWRTSHTQHSFCGSCCQRNHTSKKDIADFTDLYSGGEFDIAGRYATVIMTIYVTFTFGLALPILFFYAGLTFLNFYVTDTIALYYFYKKVPETSDRLIMQVRKVLMWSPLILFGFGYWELGNEQIF